MRFLAVCCKECGLNNDCLFQDDDDVGSCGDYLDFISSVESYGDYLDLIGEE